MPDPGDTYQKTAIRERFEHFGVPEPEDWDQLSDLEVEVAQEMVEEQDSPFTGRARSELVGVDMAYGVMLASVYDSFPDGRLTESKVQSVEQATRQAFAGFSTEAENVLESVTNTSRRAAVQGQQEALNRAAAEVGVTVSDEDILGMMDRIRGRANARRPVEERAPAIIRRHSTNANEATVSWIRGQQGRPGQEAAQEWLESMSGHERVQRAINNMGPRGESVRRAIQRAGRAQAQMDGDATNLYVNSKRAFVHESNTAFHEADVLAMEESPAVRAIRWRVSTRHPELNSSPDVCDVAADLDIHRFGPGRYHPGSAPSLLHVFCECGAFPVTVPPDEWGEIEYGDDQPPNSKPREIPQAEVSAVMRANLTAESGPVTQRDVSRATRLINQKVQIAYDKFIDF